MKQKLYYGLVLIMSMFISCEKDEPTISEPIYSAFNEQILVENTNDTILVGDTLWVSAVINSELYDYATDELIELEKASFLLSGFINNLKSDNDSVAFIDTNIDIVEENGELLLVNIADNFEQVSINLDIKFGYPNDNGVLRFGIIPRFEATYAMEFEAFVYFGAERESGTDYSDNADKGVISLTYENEYINDTIYYKLPYEYQQHYNSYYNTISMLNKEYYFFKVISRVD